MASWNGAQTMVTENLVNNQRMDTEQHGGKLIGQGVYGCAFQPALKCKTVKQSAKKIKQATSLVGKITSELDAETEFKFSEKLTTAPNAERYFILATELCTPEPRAKQTEEDLGSCGALHKVALPSMTQIVMPLGGKPLRTIPRKQSSLDFFGLGKHLLEAGALLLMKHVVHGDLHQMNVLVDTPRTARLIDFGLAWSPDELTLANVKYLDRMFNPEISQEPPEVSYIQGLLNGYRPREILAKIQDGKLPLQLLFKLYGQTKESQMKRLRSFIEGSKSFQTENRYSYYKLYWNKIDAWGLGTLLLTLFIDCLSVDNEFASSDQLVQKEGMVEDVLLGLCETEPALRLDAIEALALWSPDSAVLQIPAIQSWLKEQQSQRKELEQMIVL